MFRKFQEVLREFGLSLAPRKVVAIFGERRRLFWELQKIAFLCLVYRLNCPEQLSCPPEVIRCLKTPHFSHSLLTRDLVANFVKVEFSLETSKYVVLGLVTKTI